jgi:hypothetical protein
MYATCASKREMHELECAAKGTELHEAVQRTRRCDAGTAWLDDRRRALHVARCVFFGVVFFFAAGAAAVCCFSFLAFLSFGSFGSVRLA